MKRVIDGKRYNTETAEEVCDVSPRGYYTSDFHWEDTRLYRTPKGNWFVAGRSNAMGGWATRQGMSGRGPGSGLRVIDPETARELLEEHGTAEDVERYFEVEDA